MADHPHVHAVAEGAPHGVELCCWAWRWEDVLLRCEEHAIPGLNLCPDHLIEKARRTA